MGRTCVGYSRCLCRGIPDDTNLLAADSEYRGGIEQAINARFFGRVDVGTENRERGIVQDGSYTSHPEVEFVVSNGL